jgi:hypothetical protein
MLYINEDEPEDVLRARLVAGTRQFFGDRTEQLVDEYLADADAQRRWRAFVERVRRVSEDPNAPPLPVQIRPRVR